MTIQNPENDFWVISIDGYQYKDLEDLPVSLSSKFKKVGVLDTAELIYCFTGCHFDSQLRAYFKKFNDQNVSTFITQAKRCSFADYDAR